MTRILTYDIETAPNIGFTWEKWQTNVLEFTQDWYLISVAWRWLGENKTYVDALPDHGGYFPGDTNDFWLADRLHELFEEADITVTHNGKTFDKPKAQTRMLVHGMDPPSPHLEIDTLQVARKQFAFAGNSLDDLCRSLGLPRKQRHTGFDLWMRVMQGDPAAWSTMKSYNKRDVEILEKLYKRMLPWVPHHPNMAILDDRPEACPRCGKGPLQSRGVSTNNFSQRRRFQCQSCGGWSLSRSIGPTQNKAMST